MENNILTTEGVADLLNSHPKTIAKKVRDGDLKAYKKLGKWYIFYSDLVAWIKKEA